MAKTNTFDAGTEGDVVTAANSAAAGGDALAVAATAGTPSVVYAAAKAIRGARGIKVTATTAGTDVYTLQWSETSAAQCAFMIGVEIATATLPTAAAVCLARTRSSSANTSKIILSTAGVLAVQNAAGSTLKNFNGNAKPPDGYYWVCVRVITGTSTTTGTIEVEVYRDSDGTLLDSFSSSAVNTGTTNQNLLQFGKPEAAGAMNGHGLDEPRFVVGASVPKYTPPATGTAANVTAVTATSTAATPVPVVEGATGVEGGGPASATSAALAPTLGAGVTIAATPATATSSMAAPAVANGYTIDATTSTATADTRVPSVTAASAGGVAAIRAQGLGGAGQPTISAGSATTAPTASASGSSQPAAVGAGGTALATPAAGTAGARPVTTAAGATITTPTVLITTTTVPPTTTSGSTSTVPVTVAELAVMAPTVVGVIGLPPRDIRVVAGPTITGWLTTGVTTPWAALVISANPTTASPVARAPVTADAVTGNPTTAGPPTGHPLNPAPVTRSAWNAGAVYIEET